MKLTGISVDDFNTLAGEFAHSLDFYYWKGIPCVRKWPRKKLGSATEAQSIWYKIFKHFAEAKHATAFEIRFFYKHWTAGTTWTWGDLATAQGLEYYGATKKLPPQIITPTIDTYYGKLRYIKFRTDSPEQPYLCRKLPKENLVEYKTYRGRKEKCIRPRMGENIDCVAMKLMYSSGINYTPTWFNGRRYAQDVGYPLKLCPACQTDALARYATTPETYGPGIATVTLAQLWFNWTYTYSVENKRSYVSWLCPDYYGGIQTSRFCGIKYGIRATKTMFWPPEDWSVSVFGTHYHYPVPPVLITDEKIHPIALYPGTTYTISGVHPDYYLPRPYPCCPRPTYSIGSSLAFFPFQFLIGERWWWEYTFTAPYTSSWWLSYPDAEGRMHGVSPVSGK